MLKNIILITLIYAISSNPIYVNLDVNLKCPLSSKPSYLYQVDLWEKDYWKFGDLLAHTQGTAINGEPIVKKLSGFDYTDELLSANWEISVVVLHTCTWDNFVQCDLIKLGHAPYYKDKLNFTLSRSLRTSGSSSCPDDYCKKVACF